jgi:hypothetical protein
MKKLQVLGPGCPKCTELAKRTEEAARSAGGDFEVEKVSDLSKIMAFGVMMTRPWWWMAKSRWWARCPA